MSEAIAVVPICPFCKADPVQFAHVPAAFGSYLIGLIVCVVCRAPVTSYLMGIQEPIIDTSGKLPS